MTVLLFSFLLAPGALAEIPHQVMEEPLSRGLQQAKRVAAMENNNDLPSRTVHLGKRVAHHSQKNLACRTKKAGRKKPAREKTETGEHETL